MDMEINEGGVNQILAGEGIPLIEVDISTLDKDDEVMQFYSEIVKLVCGSNELKKLNVMEFAEEKGPYYPTEDRKKGYFVRFVNGHDSLTLLIMSGNLYIESFQANNGKFYVLGNNETECYPDRLSKYISKHDRYLLEMEKFNEQQTAAIEEARRTGNRKVKFTKPSCPSQPEKPMVYKCLEHFGLIYELLGIGSSYPKLQDAAGMNRNEILFGLQSHRDLIDRLVRFDTSDATAKQTAAEGCLYEAVFISESVRCLDQAKEMQDIFVSGENKTISDLNWKLHLCWAFASKVLRLKMLATKKGVEQINVYRVKVNGGYLEESDLEESFWTLKNGSTKFEAPQPGKKNYLNNYIYDLDKRSVDFK